MKTKIFVLATAVTAIVFYFIFSVYGATAGLKIDTGIVCGFGVGPTEMECTDPDDLGDPYESRSCVSHFECCVSCQSKSTCTFTKGEAKDPLDTYSEANYSAEDSCSDTDFLCTKENCTASEDFHGETCTVRKIDGTDDDDTSYILEDTGTWDNSIGKCIQCSSWDGPSDGKTRNNTETAICGDATDIYIDDDANCSGLASFTFREVCGADAACDGKAYPDGGPAPSCTGGTCDLNGKCVAPPKCGQNPKLTANPASQTADAGDTKTYIITITNNDDATCSNRTFDLSSSGEDNWTIKVDKSSVTLPPGGGNEDVTLSVKSPTNTSDGAYSASVTAEDSADSTKSGSVSVEYNIGSIGCPSNYDIEFVDSQMSQQATPFRNGFIHSAALEYDAHSIDKQFEVDEFVVVETAQEIKGGDKVQIIEIQESTLK